MSNKRPQGSMGLKSIQDKRSLAARAPNGAKERKKVGKTRDIRSSQEHKNEARTKFPSLIKRRKALKGMNYGK